MFAQIKRYDPLNSRFSYLSVAAVSFFAFLPFLFSIDTGLDFATVIYAVTIIAVFYVFRYAYAPILLGFAALGALEAHVSDRWGGVGFANRLETAMEAPLSEAAAYLEVYMQISDWLRVLHLFLVLCLSVWVTIRVATMSKLKIKIIALVVIFLSMPGWHYLFQHRYERPENVEYFHVIGTAYTLLGIYERSSLVSRRVSVTSAYTAPNKTQCHEPVSNIVVVIGETATRDRMSLYGYGRATTPFLKQVGGVVAAAISPTNQTRFSLPIMLSDASVSSFYSFFQMPSVVSKLKSCGYRTHWISNQTRKGIHDTYVSTIAGEADLVHYLNKDNSINFEYDSKLVDYLKRTGIRTNSPSVYFLHLMGSHLDYEDRYPEDTALLNAESLSDHYDNSIHYTDQVLRLFDAQFPEKDTVFIYVSDHGEIMGKSDSEFGHGFYPSVQEEYRVPFVIWPLKQPKVSRLKEVLEPSLVNLESLNRLIEYFAGITVEPDLSYSTQVFAISPQLVSDYLNLPEYSAEEASVK